MKRLVLVALACGLAGCGQRQQFTEAENAEAAAARRGYEIHLARLAGPPPVVTPEAARENELLERALSASPDYSAAVRRAAIANVDAAGSARRSAANPRARDAAIGAEEARLSEAVEVRRRQRLAEQAQQRQGQQDQQAAAQCIALGQQIEASMFNPRSLLNIEGSFAAVQARDNCWASYQQSRGP